MPDNTTETNNIDTDRINTTTSSPTNATSTTTSTTANNKIKFSTNIPNELKEGLNTQRANFIKEMNEEGSLLHRTLNANGYFRLEDMKFNDAFYRFPRNDPYNYVDGAREYLFFTKPDLPLIASSGKLLPSVADIPYFTYLYKSPGYKKSVFDNLCGGVTNKDKCPFMRILSNRKTSNMDIPDINVEELETAVNMYGSKILYPKSSQSSDEDIDFNIEFEDTRFLEIYHLFKAWDYFRSLRWYGLLSPALYIPEYGPNRTDRSIGTRAIDILTQQRTVNNEITNEVDRSYARYLFYKVLYDHIRVFKFLVDNDGETILHASSAIGCYPRSIQRSTFSEIADRGPLKINIGFKVSGWFEDVITNVVNDFNSIVFASWNTDLATCNQKKINIYDNEIGAVSQGLVDIPFIQTYTAPTGNNTGRASDFKVYLLAWAKK